VSDNASISTIKQKLPMLDLFQKHSRRGPCDDDFAYNSSSNNNRHTTAQWEPKQAYSRLCSCAVCSTKKEHVEALKDAISFLDSSDHACPALSYRNMPQAARLRLLDEILNSTCIGERWMPEFVFDEHDIAVVSGSAAPFGVGARVCARKQLMFSQLVDRLQITPQEHLRCRVGEVAWKTKFTGAAFQGAEGLPGPFRQSLTLICASLTTQLARTIDSSSAIASAASEVFERGALLIPCPNHSNQTGLNRNLLIVNPALQNHQPNNTATQNTTNWTWTQFGHRLEHCYRFGQLLGIAIRSKGLLTIDMHEWFWRQLVGDVELTEEEEDRLFSSFDYTAWNNLRFRDPTTGHEFDENEFKEYYGSLTYTTSASHNLRELALPQQSKTKVVSFASRHQYSRLCIKARLNESAPHMHGILRGVHSIVPKRAMRLLRWYELEKRICGSKTLNLVSLKRQTVYSPSKFNSKSEIVKNFWKVLESFTEEQKSKYLQFSWARSRLPPVYDSEDKSWRMKVNILESTSKKKTDNMLPTAETCFFNVNLPCYSSFEVMREKLLLAVTHCSSITS